MATFISNLVIHKLHGLYDFDIQLNSGTNIIYGANGSGKTTILHILANAVNQDWARFAYITFQSIEITYSNDDSIIIEQTKEEKQNSTPTNLHIDISISYTLNGQKRERKISSRTSHFFDMGPENLNKGLPYQYSALYIPAFRVLLNATSLIGSYRQINDTLLAREVFDNRFIPIIKMDSFKVILEKIDREIRESISRIIKRDSALLQRLPILRNRLAQTEDPFTEETFTYQAANISNIFEQIKQYPVYIDETIIESVKSSEVDSLLLSAYYTTWEEMLKVRQSHLETINVFFEVLNKFFNHKRIQYSPATSFEHDPPFIEIVTNSGHVVPLENGLSSGEQQLLTLLFATTRLIKEDIALIDEPEISLGTYWQSQLLMETQKLLGDKQLVICTHSIEIGENFSDDRVIVLKSFA